MRRVGKLLPSTEELAAYFEVTADTVRARLAESAELRAALAAGKADRCAKISRAQQLLATGYWRCSKCGRPLQEVDADVQKCTSHPEHDPSYVAPHPIMLIWLGKQHLGQSDKSFIESKYRGNVRDIPDEELDKLLPEALEQLGHVAIESLKRATKGGRRGRPSTSRR